MRVISGAAKGRKLKAPDGLKTRPTSELCKEAVFSIIQFEIEGSAVLDLFAGSGQMGIEALSRGARSCVFVDNAKACRAAIAENLEHTGLSGKARIIMLDAEAYLKNAAGPVDIALIDPPYGKDYFQRLFEPLAKIMGKNGVVVCESDKKDILPENSGSFAKFKEYGYGRAKITVYRSTTEENND